jgi:predicted O-methyltransferase YrrM
MAHLVDLLVAVERAGIPTITLPTLLGELSRDELPAGSAVRVHPNVTSSGSGSVGEMTALSAIVAAKRPHAVLEFGTNQGCSTWHLWANASPECEIVTIDLPSNVKVEGSTDLGIQGVTARPFLPKDNRIRLIETDSRQWHPDLRTKIDLCFIDAGHSYECVRNDTEKALKLMADDGLVVWHDAAWKRDGYGVNKYLKELGSSARDVRLLSIGPFDYCAIAVMRMDCPFRAPPGQ